MMRTFGAFRATGDEHGALFYGELLADGQTVQPLRQPFWIDPDEKTGPLHALAGLTVGVPVAPSKIIAVGRNYHAHAQERGEEAPTSPLTWLKAPSSLLAHEGFIELPYPQHHVDFEAELAIVIGRTAKNVSLAEAEDYVFGYAVSLDISDRVIQDAEGQFARAKGFDTFTPLGPFVYSGVGPDDMIVTLRQNGELRQNGRTSEMIFKVREIVSFLSQGTTLLPGDVIQTGTPAGVGPIKDGDVLETVIGPFAPLIVHVRDAAA
jgi:2-keto-4-pentenoate hydratase/2-oxohepta-3-ene-1,7-dioic acid hydratase in catechol pathway